MYHLLKVVMLSYLLFNCINALTDFALLQRTLTEVEPRLEGVHIALQLLQVKIVILDNGTTFIQHFVLTFCA